MWMGPHSTMTRERTLWAVHPRPALAEPSWPRGDRRRCWSRPPTPLASEERRTCRTRNLSRLLGSGFGELHTPFLGVYLQLEGFAGLSGACMQSMAVPSSRGDWPAGQSASDHMCPPRLGISGTAGPRLRHRPVALHGLTGEPVTHWAGPRSIARGMSPLGKTSSSS